MNTGQKLAVLSGLPSGTAQAHLLALTQGTGTGRTIFAAQMTVCVEEPQTTLVQRPAEIEVSAKRAETTTAQQGRPNRLAVLTRPARLDIVTRPASLFVVLKPLTTTFVRGLPNTVAVRSGRHILSVDQAQGKMFVRSMP